jgi:glycosyltransferase involved in cell wall biosynthesis
MHRISVVIITKNEALKIADCINSAWQLSDDIIVVDSGSTDNTIAVAKQCGANVICTEWECFGASRNKGADAAAHNWILSLDADERVTPALASQILNMQTPLPENVCGFYRENYFANKKIRFGLWGHDKVFRLYHRRYNAWNTVLIHEQLTADKKQKKMLQAHLLHYTVKDKKEYMAKLKHYALLSSYANKQSGKKAGIVKRFLSPVINFLRSFILLFGFLDGKEGYIIAAYSTYYTWLKYHYLHRLYRMDKYTASNTEKPDLIHRKIAALK